jgi:hypothetical protein
MAGGIALVVALALSTCSMPEDGPTNSTASSPDEGALDAARETIDDLQDLLADERASSGPLVRQIRELRRTLRDHEEVLDLLFRGADPPIPFTMALSQVKQHRERFVPTGASVGGFRVHAAEAGLPPQVVVSWSIDRYLAGESDLELWNGVFVWHAVPSAGGTATEWQARWTISMPLLLGLPAFVGRSQDGFVPGFSEQRAVSRIGDFGYYFDTRDVTGDGYPEILIADPSGGSGACALYRMLTPVRSGLRQILYRSHCEGDVAMVDGLVRIRGALYPNGCERAHGCGSYVKLIRWDGEGWDLVSRVSELDDREYWS